MKKVMLVFGTRPEAIKMAPLVKAFEADKDFETVVVVTAQHREMLDQVLSLFDITPHYDLNLMKPGQTLGMITAGVLEGLGPVIEKEKPDMVLVHGDTTTTFTAALAAFYAGVAVGHVEAGLRSGDIHSPFPEEANRKLTSVLTKLHLAPTAQSKENLLSEGVKEDAIVVTGNTVIDALQQTAEKAIMHDEVLEKLSETDRVILLTTHRRENQGAPMEEIFSAIQRIVATEDVHVIFPVHKNPKIRALAEAYFKDTPRVHRIEPLEYEPFVALMKRADLILTDSGGMQEEAPSLGKPVLVLRENTERPEALEAGTVRLVGHDHDKIVKEVQRLLHDQEAYEAMAQAKNPYGDGKAALRSVEAVREVLNR